MSISRQSEVRGRAVREHRLQEVVARAGRRSDAHLVATIAKVLVVDAAELGCADRLIGNVVGGRERVAAGHRLVGDREHHIAVRKADVFFDHVSSWPVVEQRAVAPSPKRIVI